MFPCAYYPTAYFAPEYFTGCATGGGPIPPTPTPDSSGGRRKARLTQADINAFFGTERNREAEFAVLLVILADE